MDPVPSGRFDAEIATIKRYYNSQKKLSRLPALEPEGGFK